MKLDKTWRNSYVTEGGMKINFWKFGLNCMGIVMCLFLVKLVNRGQKKISWIWNLGLNENNCGLE